MWLYSLTALVQVDQVCCVYLEFGTNLGTALRVSTTSAFINLPPLRLKTLKFMQQRINSVLR